MNEKNLSAEVVVAAVQGDKLATEKVLEYYDDFLNEQATRSKKSPNGEIIKYVDEDVKQELALALIEAIPKFKLEED